MLALAPSIILVSAHSAIPIGIEFLKWDYLRQVDPLVRALLVGIEVELVIVHFLEGLLVRNREDTHFEGVAPVEQICFHCWGDAVSALIQNSELRPVVKESRECNTLLLARTKRCVPLQDVVQFGMLVGAFEALQVGPFEHFVECSIAFLFGHIGLVTFSLPLSHLLGVDDDLS